MLPQVDYLKHKNANSILCIKALALATQIMITLLQEPTRTLISMNLSY